MDIERHFVPGIIIAVSPDRNVSVGALLRKGFRRLRFRRLLLPGILRRDCIFCQCQDLDLRCGRVRRVVRKAVIDPRKLCRCLRNHCHALRRGCLCCGSCGDRITVGFAPGARPEYEHNQEQDHRMPPDDLLQNPVSSFLSASVHFSLTETNILLALL